MSPYDLRELIDKQCIKAGAGMVLVTLKVGMSQADLGPFSLIPSAVRSINGEPGDAVEVDPDTAARWSAAGACGPYVPIEPPPG